MSNLYTYLPVDNNADVKGILSTRLSKSGWEKYKQRSGKKTKKAVLEWLDSLDPTFRRSNAISVLTEPIPDDAHPEIRAFRDAHVLKVLPAYKKLLELGLVKGIVRANTGNRRGTTRVTRPTSRKIKWQDIEPGVFTFSNVPHYLIETTDGRIPADVIVD